MGIIKFKSMHAKCAMQQKNRKVAGKKEKLRESQLRVSKVRVKSQSPCHDSDTALSFSFPFLDGGNKRLGELDAGLTILSEDSLRGREGVGLPNVETLSRGEVTG